MKRFRASAVAAAAFATVTASPAAAQHADPTAPRPIPDPTPEQWRADLEHYAREMEATHEDLYHTVSREAFAASLRALAKRLPTLERHQVIVELARIHATIGDGHTSLWLIPQPWNGFRMAPIRFYWLEDGVYVLAAPEAHAGVVGGRLVAVGDADVEEAMRRIEPLVHRDNAMQVRWIAPYYLAVGEVLHALGLSPARERVRYVVETEAGRRVELKLAAEPDVDAAAATFHGPFAIPETIGGTRLVSLLDGSPRPLWLSDPGRPFWHRYLEDGTTLYAQVNAIAFGGPDGTLEAFWERLLGEVDAGRARRLVLDLRHNGGGNNFLNWPIVRGLPRRTEIDRPDRLFVLISRHTFSAASHLVTHLERFTHATFIGEPTGANPNHYGDARLLTLPHSGVEVRASTVYWQNSQPKEFETRSWTPPRVAAPLTIADLRAGRDPALEAVLAFGLEPPLAERLVAALAEGGDAAERAHRAWRADPRNRYASTEAEVNALGYRLLGEGRAEDAVIVFRLNAEAYPESANVWDSLGDGYRALGRREAAIESYRRALEVDPAFAPSRANLERLVREE